MFWSSLSRDAAEIDARGSTNLFATRLWHDRVTSPIEPYAENGIAPLWDEGAGEWSFWRDWYQGVLNGNPPDWELWHQIALIPNHDWQLGATNIAQKISEVQARFLARRLPIAETIRFDATLGGFVSDPTPLVRLGLVSTTLSRVSDTLDDALADVANGLQERDPEPRQLRRMLDRYSNDPQRIEMDVTATQRDLMRRMAKDDLPASASILALVDALGECGQAVRASNPEIAENRQLLEAIAFKDISAAQRAQIGQAQPVILDLARGQLHEEMVEDLPLVIEGELAKAGDAPVRVFSRSARILIEVKRIINDAEESEARKALGQIADAGAVVGILGTIVAIGLAIVLL